MCCLLIPICQSMPRPSTAPLSRNAFLRKPSLAFLHCVGNGQQDALVVRRTKSSSAAPTHFLEHRPSSVLCPELWRCRAYNLAVTICGSGMIASIRQPSFAPFALALQILTREVLAIYTTDCLVERGLDIWQRAKGSGNRRPSHVTVSEGLRLELELASQIMYHLPGMNIHGCE
jgi:hypothetical protein